MAGQHTLSGAGWLKLARELDPLRAAWRLLTNVRWATALLAFAGLQVKKDSGDTLIWLAAGILLVGLVITFWVPRRRRWAKMTPTRVFLAGQAAHPVDFRREMEGPAREAGAPVEMTQETE